MFCVRVSQPVGSFSVSRPTFWAEPRSTVYVCGNAPFVPSQYVAWLPSTALAPTYGPLALDVVTGRPWARLRWAGGVVGGVVGGGVGGVVEPPVGGAVGPLVQTGFGHGPQYGLAVDQPELPPPSVIASPDPTQL